MTGPGASDSALHAAVRRQMLQLHPGDQLQVSGPDRDGMGSVVAIQADSEGDPLVVLVGSSGRRSTISFEFACRPAVELHRIHQHDPEAVADRGSIELDTDRGWAR
ncbi:hypothetical protein [Nakamurella lactea]|uniref:hypothetical protein n=1 Tax=Nakamurella lactea TaxID=459515 RepID=UPI000408B664|nr:hypothetical protein [Nakamurella lactea]